MQGSRAAEATGDLRARAPGVRDRAHLDVGEPDASQHPLHPAVAVQVEVARRGAVIRQGGDAAAGSARQGCSGRVGAAPSGGPQEERAARTQHRERISEERVRVGDVRDDAPHGDRVEAAGNLLVEAGGAEGDPVPVCGVPDSGAGDVVAGDREPDRPGQVQECTGAGAHVEEVRPLRGRGHPCAQLLEHLPSDRLSDMHAVVVDGPVRLFRCLVRHEFGGRRPGGAQGRDGSAGDTDADVEPPAPGPAHRTQPAPTRVALVVGESPPRREPASRRLHGATRRSAAGPGGHHDACGCP